MRARVHAHGPIAVPVSPAHLPLLGEFHPLRREFEKWLTVGHLATLLFVITAFATWLYWPRAAVIEDTSTAVVITLDRFPPPRSLDTRAHSPIHAGAIKMPIENAVPEPTDMPFDPRATIPTSEELAGGDGGDLPGLAAADSVVIDRPAPAADTGYTWFDRLPELVRIDAPAYPGLVRDAGIDGTVNVKVLITATGRVKEAVALDGSPALHDAAVASARTAVFRPALQGTRPVEVWIVIPVVFQLEGVR